MVDGSVIPETERSGEGSGPGAGLGCRLVPARGACGRQLVDACLTLMLLSLSLPFFFLESINAYSKKKKKKCSERETSIGCNPVMCPDRELNQRPLALRDDAHPTGQHLPGLTVERFEGQKSFPVPPEVAAEPLSVVFTLASPLVSLGNVGGGGRGCGRGRELPTGAPETAVPPLCLCAAWPPVTAQTPVTWTRHLRVRVTHTSLTTVRVLRSPTPVSVVARSVRVEARGGGRTRWCFLSP